MSGNNTFDPATLLPSTPASQRMPTPPPSTEALVAFGTYDAQAAEAEQKEAEKHAGNGEWYNLKDGPNVLRFLPPKPGVRTPFITRWRHWIDLPNGESVKFNCPQKMAGALCPICVRAEALKASSDKGERDKGFTLQPQRQALACAVDRMDPSKGVQLIQLPGKSVYDVLLSMRNDPRGGGDFTHPLHGFDVIIKRSGAGKKKTRYEVLPDRNNSQLADTVGQMNDWIMAQPDLASFCVVPTEPEIRDMIAEAMGGATAERTQPSRAMAPAAAPQFGGTVQTTARRVASADQDIHDPGSYEAKPGDDDDIPF